MSASGSRPGEGVSCSFPAETAQWLSEMSPHPTGSPKGHGTCAPLESLTRCFHVGFGLPGFCCSWEMETFSACVRLMRSLICGRGREGGAREGDLEPARQMLVTVCAQEAMVSDHRCADTQANVLHTCQDTQSQTSRTLSHGCRMASLPGLSLDMSSDGEGEGRSSWKTPRRQPGMCP